jgi:cobalt-precorrin-5B (C1)-methyltransferase
MVRNLDIPSISTEGTRGGTPVAVAAINECITIYAEALLMRDPVTGFEYPASWQEKCQSQDQLDDVARGFSVLTASGTVLRRGFTTGTTAAAACKAAILSLRTEVSSVKIRIPCGLDVEVPVAARDGTASCRKYAGDYPGDATADLLFVAQAVVHGDGVNLVAGAGIGIFVRDTPRFHRGTPAINPAPLACILRSMEEALDACGLSGVTVTVSVPKGEVVAQRTLNPHIGIQGGISVLGTTGLVEPWDDHLAASMLGRISTAHHVVLTTGRTGLRYARLLYPSHEVVLVGSRIGDALAAACGEIILFGLPALILKYINPHILHGTGYATVEEFSASPDFDTTIKKTLDEFFISFPHVHVVLVDRKGTVIGESP